MKTTIFYEVEFSNFPRLNGRELKTQLDVSQKYASERLQI